MCYTTSRGGGVRCRHHQKQFLVVAWVIIIIQVVVLQGWSSTNLASSWLLHPTTKTTTLKTTATSSLLLLSSNKYSTQRNNIRRRSVVSSPLWYRDHGQEHEDDADAIPSARRSSSSKTLTIPVLGPIPGALPLLVGGEMYLDPPTPMQWMTLEESILAFQQQQQQQQQNDTASSAVPSTTVGAAMTATIDASPLVAVMHDSSNMAQHQRQHTRSGGGAARYATLAAVVGMSASSSSTREGGFVDSTDVSTLVDGSSQQLLPTAARIRLVGVGRALLHDFYYRISMADLEDEDHHHDDDDDDDGIAPTRPLAPRSGDENDDDEDDLRKTPIIVASFHILSDNAIMDSTSASSSKYHDVHSRFSSPVHALARMSSAANRVIRLHDDRRRLVRGLQAAQMRLEFVHHNNNNNQLWLEEDDYDGLGLITSSYSSSSLSSLSSSEDEEQEQQQSDIDHLLYNFPDDGNIGDTLGIQQQQRAPQSLSLRLLLEKENYGLGYSASSLSSLPILTKALLEKLEPYYTAEKLTTEEFYYETLSFCALHALERYLVEATSTTTTNYWTWGLTCTNTLERLEQIYDWMWQHQQQLEQLAKQVSQDLRDCGEECTDLW